MRHLTTTMAALCIIALSHLPAAAQAPATANLVASGVRAAWEGAKRNVTRSAELMPESDYSFRPVATVRTFGEILSHVAGANYVFCSAAKGEKSPHAEAAFEKTATTRAQIIKVLGDSIAYCDAAFAALDDKRAGETVDLPFGMGKGARALPLILNTGHLQEHYGNLVTYFRIKGMVPPSSQAQ
ncbi:MAG: DinB family protein [Acidobacteria bacterium]|nr:MAG: DinB family protein [Acidobacteriota bacterium]